MKRLIKETFENCFSQARYEKFIKNLFNEIEIVLTPLAIPAGYGDHINSITFFAEYNDERGEKIDVLVVELPTAIKLERARAFQRNIVAKYLKDNTKDAALVAFYTKDSPDWRLSFVKVEYKFTDRGVKVEAGTPPKRFSFLVGEHEPSHTAQTQLFPVLNEQKKNPCVFEIEDTFSVEKVTKEFYENYRRLFDLLTKDLKNNHAFQAIVSKENIVVEDFAKKLLGQIVFLYFLQKKGWLGVPQGKDWGVGDKFFFRTIFNKAKTNKENFYNNYLEPLFYDTLNNSRRDEVDPSYSRLFDCKIPFLNGGLFEAEYDWANTYVYLHDNIFEDILSVFDLYNFTVKEDEPLEKEVAVDPEMLGKVFENLLSENLRKGQGAYYTPREIVHYMCQESLANHLSTETGIAIEKLRKLISFKDAGGNIQVDISISKNEAIRIEHALNEMKVCDPACGSGAFLVGMLNEIVGVGRSISDVLGVEEERSEYRLKKQAIQNCIYGVDIDPGAVDIAKLRLWLTLVVDYELKDIEPLPNLDYKIMCGNSLLEDLFVGDEAIQLFDSKLLGKVSGASQKRRTRTANNLMQMTLFGREAEEYLKGLRELHLKYFGEYNPEKKKIIRERIEKIEMEFINHSIQERIKDIDVRMKNLNMQLPGHRKQQAELMKRKIEFLAIPNEINRSKVKPYFLWKLNFFEVFKDEGGFDVVIGNPPWGQKSVKFSKTERERFKKIYPSATIGIIDIFRLFIERAIMILNPLGSFANVLPDIILLKNYDSSRKFILDNLLISKIDHWGMAFESVNLDSCTLIGIKSMVQNKENNVIDCIIHSDNETINNNILQSQFFETEGYKFNLYMSGEISDLINKLKKEKRFGDYFVSHEGIHSGNIRHKLFIDNKLNNNCHKLIFGRKEVGKYRLIWNGKWVNYDKSIIDKSRGEYAGLGRSEYFSKPKIIVRRTGDYILGALDENGYYFSNNFFVCFAKENLEINAKYILGILNSKLATWFYRSIQPRKGKIFAELKINVLKQIPMKETTLSNQKLIGGLVEKVLIAKKKESSADTSSMEDEIDRIVYEIFMLSDEQRQMIEKTFMV